MPIYRSPSIATTLTTIGQPPAWTVMLKYSPCAGRVAKVYSSRTGDERDSPTTTTFFNPIQGQGGYRGD